MELFVDAARGAKVGAVAGRTFKVAAAAPLNAAGASLYVVAVGTNADADLSVSVTASDGTLIWPLCCIANSMHHVMTTVTMGFVNYPGGGGRLEIQ